MMTTQVFEDEWELYYEYLITSFSAHPHANPTLHPGWLYKVTIKNFEKGKLAQVWKKPQSSSTTTIDQNRPEEGAL